MTSVFITIPWFLPAYKAGGPVQSIANMVKELNQDIRYYIFCSNTDLNGEVIPVEADNWIDYNACTQVYYSSRKNISNRLHTEIEKKSPDVLYIIGLFSWHFNIVPLFFCKANKKILSVRGMLHSGALSQKKIKKQLFLLVFRLSGLHKKILFHATDETEKEEIEQNFSKDIRISLASNFPGLIPAGNVIHKKEGHLKMVCIALIGPMKNHLLVLRALQLVKENVVFDIYGPVKDMEYWQECLAGISLLAPNIKVNYRGDLQPALVPDALQQADIFIMPSKSENFGHSLVEALSAGLPVITSNNTPWKGLEMNHAGINVEEDPLNVSAAITKFAVMGEEEFDSWRKAAGKYIQHKINIAAITNEYKTMFEVV